jgi:hypothetical protein
VECVLRSIERGQTRYSMIVRTRNVMVITATECLGPVTRVVIIQITTDT